MWFNINTIQRLLSYTSKLCQSCWKLRDVIVGKVESLYLFQGGQRLGHNLEPVVWEIKHLQVEEEAEGVRQSGDLIVTQIEDLEVRNMKT